MSTTPLISPDKPSHKSMLDLFYAVGGAIVGLLIGVGFSMTGLTSVKAGIECLYAAALLLCILIWISEHLERIGDKRWRNILRCLSCQAVLIALLFLCQSIIVYAIAKDKSDEERNKNLIAALNGGPQHFVVRPESTIYRGQRIWVIKAMNSDTPPIQDAFALLRRVDSLVGPPWYIWRMSREAAVYFSFGIIPGGLPIDSSVTPANAPIVPSGNYILELKSRVGAFMEKLSLSPDGRECYMVYLSSQDYRTNTLKESACNPSCEEAWCGKSY